MKRVLIVDDHVDILEMMSFALDGIYETSTALNGAEAIEALRWRQYDVVVLDLMMPVMDGEQTVAEMRRLGIEAPVF